MAEQHSWKTQPRAAAWVRERVDEFLADNPAAAEFQNLLRDETGTRLVDWIDHFELRDVTGIEEAGYVRDDDGWFRHPEALLPPVVFREHERLLLRVDSVRDFVTANAHRFACDVGGEPLDLWRTASVRSGSSRSFGVVERQGCRTSRKGVERSPHDKLLTEMCREQLRTRRRRFEDRETAFRETRELLTSMISRIGVDVTCELFFEAERAYWQSRNRAARVQYMRQQTLGLGWGNHDHHTYRSSRAAFHHLVGILELLGFHGRERFYAGADAGWGAQVLEQPVTGIVIFADVDLSPEEITGDIAHEPLPPRDSVGTIGLWCYLHGEAIFEAGMHHLECQFEFDNARRQLEQFGIRCMAPFTDFPHLRQCFTEGEVWAVEDSRIAAALQQGWITPEQADRFAASGVVGSHLEILERNDGYRGFNQTGINDIIRKTDPRFLTSP
ncbi:MAG: hypothetical protein R3C19_24975 [Planctomycetaceae bacterium]